jgi:sodium/bile acid cotransporter 7
MKRILKRVGLDGFILSLFGAILLAWIYPYFGAKKGVFSLSTLANLGVSVIFFFYGLRLNWGKIRTGLANVKMHIVVVLSTFLLFPLIVLGAMSAIGVTPTHDDVVALQASAENQDRLTKENNGSQDAQNSGAVTAQEDRNAKTGIWLGIFFLAALPSTVSSSVVMTNIARGNVPAAIFDASISSLLGVFITPLWMRLFIDASTGGRGLCAVLLSLTIQVVIPICLGIYANRYWEEFSLRNEKKLRKFDQSTIVLIVYVSFCSSFAEKMFSGLSVQTIILLTLGMVVLFFVVYGIIFFICRVLRFNREDTIATLFCGSKKSLVHGAAMSRVILDAPQMAGILILPTMIYHAMQLIIVSILAQRFARKAENDTNIQLEN